MANFSSFELAGDEPREMTVNEVKALKELCQGLPPQPIIFQIGAGEGCSTLAMLEERPNALVVSIDTHERANERLHIAKARLNYRRVVRALGNSQDIGTAWPWDCDMLYTDADHRYLPVARDMELWVPKVRPGGVIAFHDCYRPGNKPKRIQSQVCEAIEEWLTREPHREILWVERVRAFVQ